jgi:hypothetical protein
MRILAGTATLECKAYHWNGSVTPIFHRLDLWIRDNWDYKIGDIFPLNSYEYTITCVLDLGKPLVKLSMECSLKDEKQTKHFTFSRKMRELNNE